MKILIILGRGVRLLLAGVVLIGIEGGVPYMLVRFAASPSRAACLPGLRLSGCC
ncbi:hypothetical protein [Nonomuraea africana]|uniref:hypothetical protein n=1 Tax=Nonomuraea africana TaxID=46171 RepID=UPI0033E64A2E